FGPRSAREWREACHAMRSEWQNTRVEPGGVRACTRRRHTRGSWIVYSRSRRVRAPPGPRAGLSPPLGCRSRRDVLLRGLGRGPQAGKGDVMPTLPPSPSLDQLRHQAKELLRAAHAGDGAAISRIDAVSDQLTLAAAQLALARAYGFASWPTLKQDVEARALDLTDKVDAFCEASIRGRMGRAARLLA